MPVPPPPAPAPSVRVRPARAEELAGVGRLTVAAYAADVSPSSSYAAVLADAAGRAAHARLLVAVDPAARRRGVGEALVRATVAEARAAACRRYVLSTLPTMVAAHRLYERLGFRRAPALDHDPVAGVHLLAYALDLQSGT